MKVAILGYGKMGHEIEKVLIARGHEITLKSCTHKPFLPADLKNTDVAIEFTRPDSAAENILKCFEAGCPVVVGTTGWYQRLPEIREAALSGGQALLYSTNFSIGVNIVFHLNRELAKIMNKHPEYNASITEIHHLQKLDKPSGTSITMAEGILEEIPSKKNWVNEESGNLDELGIVSIREADTPGTHHIQYTSQADSITLTHQAFNRSGFATGAVQAAEWLSSRKGCFTMRDFLHF